MAHRIEGRATRVALAISLIAMQVIPASGRPISVLQKTPPPDAVAIIDEVVPIARQLRLTENRVLVLAQAADLFWPRDQKRARALFVEVSREFVAASSQAPDPESEQDSRWLDRRGDVRRQVVSLMAAHDPALAVEFLRATPSTDAWSREDPTSRERREAELETEIATRAIETRPDLAFEVAEKAISRRLTYALPNLLQELARRNPDAARTLVARIVERFAGEGFPDVFESAPLISYLLTSANVRPGSPPQGYEPWMDVEHERALLGRMVTLALTVPTELFADEQRRYQVYAFFETLRTLVPRVRDLDPARAPLLERRIAEYDAAAPRQIAEARARARLMAEGSPDELLEAASKATDQTRSAFVQAAATRVFDAGDVERARAILDERLADAATRNSTLGAFERQLYERALQAKRYDEALDRLGAFAKPAERVSQLCRIAAVLRAGGERAKAEAILSEARTVVGAEPQTLELFSAAVNLAHAYAQLDPARALETAAPLVAQANRLLDASETLGAFTYDRCFFDGEMPSMAPCQLSQVTSGLESLVAVVAYSDPGAAVALANQFGRPELRARCLLAAVRSMSQEHADEEESE